MRSNGQFNALKRNKNIQRFLCTAGIGLSVLALSGCALDGTSSWDSTTNEGYFMPSMSDDYNNPPINTQEYDTSLNTYHENYTPPSNVVVPQSHYVGGLASTPPTAKDEDKQWVEQRDPNNYTIEVKKDSKASHVANTLQKMPKNERSVEVKSHSGEFLGLHGTYSNREAAETQLNNLPPDIKEQAKIKKWQSIQSEVEK